MTLKRFSFLLVSAVFICGCKYDPLNVDSSQIQVKLNFVNMDSLFSKADSSEMIALHNRFKSEIPEIYDYELGYCLGIGNVTDTAFQRSMSMFLSDAYVNRVEKHISSKFRDLNKYKEEMRQGFKNLKFHIKNGKVPDNIVFMNSFFASNAFCTQKEIGIGLERYLGSKTDVIAELPPDQFYEWMKDGLDEKYLSRDAICSWIMTHYVDDLTGNLAEHLIRWGKIIYLTEAAFPDEEESLILRYSEEDYKWALDHEYDVWQYLVKDKLLFKTDEKLRVNLLNDGPFTVGLPEKGPDRLGQFIGWRMIHKYMEIKKVTVEEMMNTPYTAILAEYEID